MACVFASDIVNFTRKSTSLTPDTLIATMSALIDIFDTTAVKYGLIRCKLIGDAYIACCGLLNNVEAEAAAKAVVGFAVEVHKSLAEFNREHNEEIYIRCGVHIGPLTSAVLGSDILSYELYGGSLSPTPFPMYTASTTT